MAPAGGLPPATYGPLGGTTVAGAHVSPLAALVLAHHPDFHSSFRVRGAQQVDHFRSLILASCHPVLAGCPGVGPGPHWTPFGGGLPDAAVAVGVVPPTTAWAFPPPAWGSVVY